MAEMEMLLTQEIPSARQALLNSHDSLKKVASYCAQKYVTDVNKTAALEETKQYTTQSLASVAYQINTLASNMLHMLDIQATHLSEMEDSVNNISQTVDIHREKVARREIGLLTANKIIPKDKPIVPPENPERPVKYVRKAIDYTELDDIGHGVKLDSQTSLDKIHKTSVSSMVKRSPKPSAKLIQKHDSIRSNASSHGTLRAVKTPAVPQEYVPNSHRLSSLFVPRTNSSSSIDSSGHNLPPADAIPPPPPPVSYDDVDRPSVVGMQKSSLANDVNGGYSIPNAPTVALAPPFVGNSTAESYATASVLDLPLPPPSHLLDDVNQEHSLSSSQSTNPATPSDFGIAPPPPPNFPVGINILPPPPPPPDTVSMVSSGAGSSVHGYALEPDWVPKSYVQKMVVIYDYSANNPDELDLREDQVVYVVKKNDDGWYEGVLDGVTGLFPGNYAEPVSG